MQVNTTSTMPGLSDCIVCTICMQEQEQILKEPNQVNDLHRQTMFPKETSSQQGCVRLPTNQLLFLQHCLLWWLMCGDQNPATFALPTQQWASKISQFSQHHYHTSCYVVELMDLTMCIYMYMGRSYSPILGMYIFEVNELCVV